MNAELKPCPFCGGTDLEILKPNDWSDTYSILCSCTGEGPCCETECDAIEKWNERVAL